MAGTVICKKYKAVDGMVVNRTTGKPIPDDEPLMLFRAKDKRTIKMLCGYISECEDKHHQLIGARRLVNFLQYQVDNPDLVSEPDTDPLPEDEQ